jgi:hypothetical protein
VRFIAALMQLPIDDHMVHRGHAVFDTCNVEGGKKKTRKDKKRHR